VEQRERIEARLDARLEELKRTRLAMHREGDGMRGSELAYVDNHPGDIGTDTRDEELDETAEARLAPVRCLEDQRRFEGLHRQHMPQV
jgi:hypothetical protein